MTNDISLETKFIERFVVNEKQARFLSFILKEKTREKFIGELHHMRFLKSELFDKVDGDEQDFIFKRLKTKGNYKDCYVISENKKLDKQRLDIYKALTEIIGSDMGTLLVFGDAEVLYSEGEGFNNRLISK